MLAVTTEAAHAIQDLVGGNPQAGLRISAQAHDGNEVQLGLAVTEHPDPTDEVVHHEGSQVFVDQEVAPLLDGRTLDAKPTADQKLAFTLLP